MPTSLPSRPIRRAKLDIWVVFVVALATGFFVVELLDPAPMDVAAAWVAAP
jgi:hypothetical protein